MNAPCTHPRYFVRTQHPNKVVIKSELDVQAIKSKIAEVDAGRNKYTLE